MSSTYARLRSTEAPMQGLEFTDRAKTIPAWRVTEQATPLKRSHSVANPPLSPFNSQHNRFPKPVFGSDVRFLFSAPIPQSPIASTSLHPRPRTPETPEVIMNDFVHIPPAPSPSPLNVEEEPTDDTKGVETDKTEKGISVTEVRPMSNVAVRRIERRRRIAEERSRFGRQRVTGCYEHDEDGTDDDFDEELPRISVSGSRKTSNHYTLNMPGPAIPTSDMPYVLLGYIQVLFNLSLILIFLYLLLQFILTVQRDVEQRITEYSMEILQDITTCTTQYKTNLCDTNPIPAMVRQCAAWETCMSRDPKVVGRAKVGAEMLAEVVNGFVEPISWKTLLFTLSSLSFLTVFVNALLSLYRSRHSPDKRSTDRDSNTAIHLPPQSSFMPIASYPPPQGYGYIPTVWHPEQGVEEIPSRRRRLDNGEKAAVQ